MDWDPQRYVQFGSDRDRPFFDLTGRIGAVAPRRVVDLGCGTGHLTAALARRWPQAQVLGLDNSPAMIDAARAGADLPGNLDFELADLAGWVPEPGTDVVVTNAALQWVPEHQALLGQWFAALEPGAWFALQVPGNFDAPSHALMRQEADSPRWRDKLSGVLRHADTVGGPADYLDLAAGAGWHADAWETTYQQVLAGDQPVLDWVRGTGLRPILAALEPDDAAEFERSYGLLLEQAYPARPYGTVFPFRRIFCVAHHGRNGA